MNTTSRAAEFDGQDTVVAGDNPVWVKVGGMTLQVTPTDTGVIVDAWRKDDEPMTEPWTVEFDGERVDVR